MEFQKLPDWQRYPLPETFYKTFNISKPKPAEINEFLQSHLDSQFSSWETPIEERPAAEGGVRPLELPEPMPVETEVIPDEPAPTLSLRRSTDEMEAEPPPISEFHFRSKVGTTIYSKETADEAALRKTQ